jgi:hypothetical protein
LLLFVCLFVRLFALVFSVFSFLVGIHIRSVAGTLASCSNTSYELVCVIVFVVPGMKSLIAAELLCAY